MKSDSKFRIVEYAGCPSVENKSILILSFLEIGPRYAVIDLKNGLQNVGFIFLMENYISDCHKIWYTGIIFMPI